MAYSEETIRKAEELARRHEIVIDEHGPNTCEDCDYEPGWYFCDPVFGSYIGPESSYEEALIAATDDLTEG